MPASPLLRPLGATKLEVTPVAMGCWPIAGMTSIDVNTLDSTRTLEAAIDAGLNFFDTAFCYGPDGESERLVGQVLTPYRDRVVIATKGGIHWNDRLERVFDARPETLRRECESSLRRLSIQTIDLYYLHAPDPQVPIAESAGAIARLIESGKVRAAGASNVSVEQLTEFLGECPVAAVQPHYNMLQREIEPELVPFCRRRQISLVVYWPLMKGLLAGALKRDHRFAPNDGRAKYPMFQGQEWDRNQDFVDRLREIAAANGRTVAQVVVNWTLHRPGITSVLCGAKRAYQIEETAGAMGWNLTAEELAQIDRAIAERGTPVTRAAVDS